MQREDQKLKNAIGKHYKKLAILERARQSDVPAVRFSEHLVDLMSAIGYVPSA